MASCVALGSIGWRNAAYRSVSESFYVADLSCLLPTFFQKELQQQMLPSTHMTLFFKITLAFVSPYVFDHSFTLLLLFIFQRLRDSLQLRIIYFLLVWTHIGLYRLQFRFSVSSGSTDFEFSISGWNEDQLFNSQYGCFALLAFI